MQRPLGCIVGLCDFCAQTDHVHFTIFDAYSGTIFYGFEQVLTLIDIYVVLHGSSMTLIKVFNFFNHPVVVSHENNTSSTSSHSDV